MLERYTYSAYGVPAEREIAASGNPLRYTARPWDAEIGLNNHRVRVYSPSLGRFLQPDPIGYGDGLNMYAYVGNDPVNLVDPTGMGAEAAKQGAGRGLFSTGNFLEENERAISIGIGVLGVAADIATIPSGEGAAAVAAAPVAARGLIAGVKRAGRKLSSSGLESRGAKIPGGRKISDTTPSSNKISNASGDVFKRVDFALSKPHSGLSSYIHPNYRNVLPDGSIRTGVSGHAQKVTRKDIIDAARPDGQRVGSQ